MDGGSNNMNEAWCARLEGKVDLINERHARVTEDVKDARERLHAHSNRIQVLESENRFAKGHTQGASSVVKMLWAVLAVMLTGGVVTVAMLIKVVAHA